MKASFVRIKKTGQQVLVVGQGDPGYTLCLFPFNRVTDKGFRGRIQPVRDENLVDSRQTL